MNGQVSKYAKFVNQLEKGLPPNNVVPQLKEKVEKMKEKVQMAICKCNIKKHFQRKKSETGNELRKFLKGNKIIQEYSCQIHVYNVTFRVKETRHG